jgi:enolase
MIKISARQIDDSRGRPTIEVEARYGDFVAIASVPSGKSTGSREALELRDEDGGVSSAIHFITTEIAEMLAGMELVPLLIDAKLRELDGTNNYSRIGANTVLAVSIAMRRLAALKDRVPLWRYIASESNSVPTFPALFMNMINGGAHAGFNLTFQEHIAVIHGAPHLSYEKGIKIYENLGGVVRARCGEVPLGDEGGFAPILSGGEDEAFELLAGAIANEDGVQIAIDAAASEFFKDAMYHVGIDVMSGHELGEKYLAYISSYSLVSIEDPFSEFDEESFAPLLATVPKGIWIVGDDVTVTNKDRVQVLAESRSVNAMIVKPNQVGTLSDVYEAVKVAREAGWKLIASHRSGETMDSFLADFAVGIGADGMKAGAPSQVERRVKYERLLEIEDEAKGEIGV